MCHYEGPFEDDATKRMANEYDWSLPIISDANSSLTTTFHTFVSLYGLLFWSNLSSKVLAKSSILEAVPPKAMLEL